MHRNVFKRRSKNNHTDFRHMNSIEYVASILKQEGVEWMACYPSNPLIEAVAKEGIRPVAFRHERGAVMAADGFSRLSDRKRFGVVAMQSQAGAENSVGGLSQAYADNVPILVLPGGNPLDMLFIRPNFFAARTWESVVKKVEFISRPDQTGNVMRRAFHALRSGSTGPVVVEMPIDVCMADIPERARPYTSPMPALSRPSPHDLEDAAKALVAAKNPLIWAGAGVLSAGATEELRAVAELLDIPVYTSMPGKSAFDERHPLSVGAGGSTVTGPARQWLDDADVIFAIGASLTSSPYAQRFSPEKFLIHSVINIDEINKDTVADIGLAGDARLTLTAILDIVKGLIGESPRSTGVQDRIAKSRAEWMESWLPYLTNDDVPISPYRVIHEMGQNLDLENSVVTHDAGAPRDQIVPFYTATTPHSYVGWGKSTHLGFSIPLMIGAKMAMPERFCANLMGDGAFGMSGLDIETSSRAGIPITTVVLNNGMMATYPGGFPTAREQFGVSHMQGNYATIAQGMGAEGIVVEKTEEIAPALTQAQQFNADGKTVLIDVRTRAEDSRAPSRFV
ncbi:MAG: thiamine pyrophosphate-requiring protein [Pseudomonadota bacterium]|nr:thiamine pyrophosphate-requiring protein [Pseudomonadota bacterium]